MSNQTIKLRRGTFQHIESELYAYHETMREIVRLKNDILHGKTSDDENAGGGRSSLPGDPTGRTATLLASHTKLEQMQHVTRAIEWVVERLPDDKRRLVEKRYWTRPQTLTWDGLALELNISRRTALNWRDEIINSIAVKLGWH
ncbi:transcriptional regulator [Paenibacillus thailandensis]|uniref:Transcriptional regulator n=1 Tax=Paenibacillus thailandensis TaxID=393250 RepID=A0ABW5QST6_9BACL